MALKKLSKLQILKKNLLSIYKRHKKEIFDIIIFGSITKGKEREFVKDIDICIIFKGLKQQKILDELNKLKNLHINYLYLDELYIQTLWKTLIREGISIIHNKRISELFNLEPYGLYTYELKSLKNKSRFSQVLKGYKAESILKKVNGIILKPGVILIPIQNIEFFRTFLETWNVKYTLKYIYVLK